MLLLVLDNSALALGYVADFTKAITNPMDYKCLLYGRYEKVSSTFLEGISLFEINTTTTQ